MSKIKDLFYISALGVMSALYVNSCYQPNSGKVYDTVEATCLERLCNDDRILDMIETYQSECKSCILNLCDDYYYQKENGN